VPEMKGLVDLGIERDHLHRVRVVVFVEDQQIDRGCMTGVQCEPDAVRVGYRTERVRPAHVGFVLSFHRRRRHIEFLTCNSPRGSHNAKRAARCESSAEFAFAMLLRGRNTSGLQGCSKMSGMTPTD